MGCVGWFEIWDCSIFSYETTCYLRYTWINAYGNNVVTTEKFLNKRLGVLVGKSL